MAQNARGTRLFDLTPKFSAGKPNSTVQDWRRSANKDSDNHCSLFFEQPRTATIPLTSTLSELLRYQTQVFQALMKVLVYQQPQRYLHILGTRYPLQYLSQILQGFRFRFSGALVVRQSRAPTEAPAPGMAPTPVPISALRNKHGSQPINSASVTRFSPLHYNIVRLSLRGVALTVFDQ